MDCKPLGSQVVLQEVIEPYFGAIDIPEKYQPKPNKGIILRTGDGIEDPNLIPDQKVLFRCRSKHIIDLGDGKLLVPEKEILGTFTLEKPGHESFRPRGRRLLIRRKTGEGSTNWGFVIPADSEDRKQTRLGILWDYGEELEEEGWPMWRGWEINYRWDMSIQEVGMNDGHYYLVCPVEHCEYVRDLDAEELVRSYGMDKVV